MICIDAVAVKICHDTTECPEEEHVKLILEAGILALVSHKNILKLVGICFDKIPSIMVTEYMIGGDLKTYLRMSSSNTSMHSITPVIITMRLLIDVTSQVAAALAYLEDRKLIHRDIAARNVLVGASLADVKLADFGMARNLYHSTDPVYLSRTEQRIPFKWMAPEVIRDLTNSTKSDVWSFGVLCWEIFSLGQTPYAALTTRETLLFILAGKRLIRPAPLCPIELYSLMLECWDLQAVSRPTFVDIFARITALLFTIPFQLLNEPAASSNLDKQCFDETQFNLMPDGRGIRLMSIKRENPLFNTINLEDETDENITSML